MRFMLLMIPKGYENAAPGTIPAAEAVEAMMRFNKSLKDAGVLLTLDGLHPPSMGARVTFPDGKPVVSYGPFEGVNETLGGYWMIQVDSREEAIGWASLCPASDDEIVEVRQVQDITDFPAEIQKAAAKYSEAQNPGFAID